MFDTLCYSGYVNIVQYILSNGYEPGHEKITKLIKQVNEIITGECDDYCSNYEVNEVNEEHLIWSLEGILNLLKLKL